MVLVDPSLPGVLEDHVDLQVQGIPLIQDLQLDPSIQHPHEVHLDQAALETLACHLCLEAHLSPSHPEDLQAPAHQELPERARPPSVTRPLLWLLLFPEGGDVTLKPGQRVIGPLSPVNSAYRSKL